MNGVSTTTTILLLTEKVESLEHYFGYVNIALVCAGIVVAVVAILQVFLVLKYRKSELLEVEDKIKKENQIHLDRISDDLSSKIDSLSSATKERIEGQIRQEVKVIERRFYFLEADINRSMALTAQDKGMYHKAFAFWISAAASSVKIGDASKEFLTICLKSAQNNLEEFKGDGVFSLRDDLPSIEMDLKKVEVSRPTEVKLIKDLLISKLKQKVG